MAAPLSCRGHEKAALAVALCLLCVTGAAPLSAHDHHHGNHHHHNHRHHHRRHEREGLSTSSTPASPTPAAWVTQTMGQVGWLSRVSQTAGVNKGCACSARKRACPAGGGVLSMKARRKNARSAGGVAGAGGATATAVGRGGGAKKGKKTKALYIQIEDLESDSWRYSIMRSLAPLFSRCFAVVPNTPKDLAVAARALQLLSCRVGWGRQLQQSRPQLVPEHSQLRQKALYIHLIREVTNRNPIMTCSSSERARRRMSGS